MLYLFLIVKKFCFCVFIKVLQNNLPLTALLLAVGNHSKFIVIASNTKDRETNRGKQKVPNLETKN